MKEKFDELKKRVEQDNSSNVYDLLIKIVYAYEAGLINNKEYVQLFELANERKNKIIHHT